MKKILITVLLTLILSVGYSQNKVKFGLKGGYNRASITKESGTRNSIHFGGVARISLSDKFAIQPELLYSLQGGHIANTEFTANYLSLPIVGSYNLTDNFSIEVGPELSYLTYAEVRPVIVTKYLDKFHMGLNAGVSYRLTNGLFVQARYCFGLTKLSDNKEYFDFDRNNRAFQLSIGYFF